MNQQLLSALPWLTGLLLILTALVVLRRPLGRLWRFGVRSAGGLAALVLFSRFGRFLGISLGVNWLNALVLGLLGLPGFGLLLMLQWVLQSP